MNCITIQTCSSVNGEQGHHLHLLSDKRFWVLEEKTYFLMQQKGMKDNRKAEINARIDAVGKDFNLYSFINIIRQTINV